MKKFLFTIALLAINIVAFPQIYGEFSMPHTTSMEVLNQYVGQRIKVPRNKEDKHNNDIFDYHSGGGDVDNIYKITKVKVNSKFITFFLQDPFWEGVKPRVKVNIDGARNYEGMTSCESIFLVDKHEKYKKDHIEQMTGYKFLNKSGKEVAQITQIEYGKRTYPKTFEYTIRTSSQEYYCLDLEKAKKAFEVLGEPFINENKDTIAIFDGLKNADKNWDELTYYFKNSYDGTICAYTIEDFSKLQQRVGEVLTHPRVKHAYRIVGIDQNDEYIVVNTTTNQKKNCKAHGIENNAFNSDLAGRYVSILSKVEKPSNPSIRYGKAKTIEGESDITKYSYVDNVIDMLIIGDSEEFSFILKNISDNSIKIIWNEAVFVDFDGTTSKVMHVGTKYSQREEDQPATTIIKGAKIEDIAVPTCNVRYSSVLEEWVQNSMFPSNPDQEPGQLRLMLPIQIKDVVNEYVFVFDVKYVYNHPEVLIY